MKPITLPPNLLHHFYAGGERIAALRGVDLGGDDHRPEEWLAAVNSAFGEPERGPSRLPDGTLVRDAIAADPDGFLGPAHVARYGGDAALLTKLLDAGERLPVHFHPGRAFAAQHLGLDHGKTEAWIIIDAQPGASVRVGFAEAVDEETLRGWMRAQDSAAMLSALRELPVAAGDAVFVPAGAPHAIGAGVFMVELQEPTDLSVVLEWRGFALEEDAAHLGLGWHLALEALDRTAWDDARVAALRGDGCLLPADADPYFRAEWLRGGGELAQGFAVLVGLGGAGTLATEAGGTQPFARGDALLVPHAAGAGRLDGVDALVCRPPAADAGSGRW